MSFFTDPDGDPFEQAPIQAHDFASIIDVHVAFAERIERESRPGRHGIDVDRAMRDAAAIEKHRCATWQSLLLLLRLWKPEPKILN